MFVLVYRVCSSSLTGFQATPVNLFEERMLLELGTLIVLEAEALGGVLLHQTFTNGFAVCAEAGCVRDWIVQDPASDLVVLNLGKEDRASVI